VNAFNLVTYKVSNDDVILLPNVSTCTIHIAVSLGDLLLWRLQLKPRCQRRHHIGLRSEDCCTGTEPVDVINIAVINQSSAFDERQTSIGAVLLVNYIV